MVNLSPSQAVVRKHKISHGSGSVAGVTLVSGVLRESPWNLLQIGYAVSLTLPWPNVQPDRTILPIFSLEITFYLAQTFKLNLLLYDLVDFVGCFIHFLMFYC